MGKSFHFCAVKQIKENERELAREILRRPSVLGWGVSSLDHLSSLHKAGYTVCLVPGRLATWDS